MLALLLACTATTLDSDTLDLDGDGFVDDDCYEGRADIFPDAPELCDGWDNDCDGSIDESPVDGTAFHVDSDGDGFGAGEPTWSCEPLEALVANDQDCDDSEALAWTGAAEQCGDGVDNDCDGDEDCDDEDCADALSCDDDTAFEGATELNLVVVDYLTLSPLEGVQADGGDDNDTSDASGALSLQLGTAGPIEVSFTAEGYPLHTLSGHGGPDGQLTQVNAAFPMISTSTLSFLAGALGVSIDPADGLVNVSIVDHTGASLAGVTVESSASSDVALVPDKDSTTKLSPGSTTLEGSTSSVFFINAEAGTTTYTVTPPDGYICVEAPGGHLPIQAETTAGAVNAVMVACVPSG